MNDIKITSQKNVKINQKGRCSKYRWLYDEIDEMLKEGETLVIENLDTVREARLHISAIRRQYDRLVDIRLRKYTVKGFVNPTIYLDRR